MEYESKFLDMNYIKTRLIGFKEIRNKVIQVEIYQSEQSSSLYIKFFYDGYHCTTMRISDHKRTAGVDFDFCINKRDILSKSKKREFVNKINACIVFCHNQATRERLKRL